MNDYVLTDEDKEWQKQRQLASAGSIEARAWLEAYKRRAEAKIADTEAKIAVGREAEKQEFENMVSEQQHQMLIADHNTKVQTLQTEYHNIVTDPSPSSQKRQREILIELRELEKGPAIPEAQAQREEESNKLKQEYSDLIKLIMNPASADQAYKTRKRMGEIQSILRSQNTIKMKVNIITGR